MKLLPLPAFQDNYLWLLHDGHDAIVVDPGDAAPVFSALDGLGLRLAAILVTHHHADHTGGVAELREQTQARVYAPAYETVPEPCFRVGGGDSVGALGLHWQVIDVPGHTAGHVAFFHPDVAGQPMLFCGDTLFSGGCGRLFEGTPAQMLDSLERLAALPDDTRVCCAHEYTLSNLRFALAVEPDNAALRDYRDICEHQRQQGLPTLPAVLATERAINPFLRTRTPSVAQAVAQHGHMGGDDPIAVFAHLREWKNNFR